jgi:hypothetical protein
MTECHIPEDFSLHQHHCENVKSHIIQIYAHTLNKIWCSTLKHKHGNIFQSHRNNIANLECTLHSGNIQWTLFRGTLTIHMNLYTGKAFLWQVMATHIWTYIQEKLSCSESWRLRVGMECWAAIFTLTMGTTRMAELSAITAGCTLPPKEISWYSFLLEAQWTLSYWKRTWGLDHLNIYKHHTGNPSWDLPSCGTS